MFVVKAKGLPYSGVPKRTFNVIVSSLICKHLIRLKRLARDKHSSLLQFSYIMTVKSLITFCPSLMFASKGGA
jgi:hypothetical protein